MSLSDELSVAPIFCGTLKVEKLTAAFGVKPLFCENAKIGINASAMIAESVVNVFLVFINFLLLFLFLNRGLRIRLKKAFQTTSDSFRDGGIVAHSEKVSNESFEKNDESFGKN